LDEAARRLLENKLRLSSITVHVNAEESSCPMCGDSLTVQKTSFVGIVTNKHGTLNGWWPKQECPNGCKCEDGRAYTRRAEKLDNLVMKNHKFGYDLEVEVGICRYLKHMQINDIVEKYGAEGKKMSPASISRYSHKFLEHLEMLHVAHLPAIAKVMADEGGYYMLFDSTCEAGSGSLFTVLAGWRNWTVGSWQQSTENAEEMLPHVAYLVEVLGLPLAIMKDLSVQGRNVAEEIMRAYPDAVIRIFACHFHFVKDIGKDILYAEHNALKGRIRDAKAALARLIRDTRDKVTDDPESVARTVEKWLAAPESVAMTLDSDAVAVVRYLSQWILDSSQDGDNGQFPFELPYLLFYDRAIRMSKMAETILNSSEASPRSAAYSLLNRLHRITAALAGDQEAAKTATMLRSKNGLFVKLRTVMQLEKKEKIEDACKTVEERKEFHQKVKAKFDGFVDELRKMQEFCDIEYDLKMAAGIILKHVDKYNDELWGHDIPIIDGNGNISMRVADRTNNPCEQAFAKTKSDERRRSGRKNLKWNLTVRPAEASLIENLKDEEYLRLVCNGSLDELPALFADLENCPPLGLTEQLDAYRRSAETVFESGRLPRADVKVIRSDAFKSKINRIEAVSAQCAP